MYTRSFFCGTPVRKPTTLPMIAPATAHTATAPGPNQSSFRPAIAHRPDSSVLRKAFDRHWYYRRPAGPAESPSVFARPVFKLDPHSMVCPCHVSGVPRYLQKVVPATMASPRKFLMAGDSRPHRHRHDFQWDTTAISLRSGNQLSIDPRRDLSLDSL